MSAEHPPFLESKEFDFTIVFVSDGAAGKSSIIRKQLHGHYVEDPMDQTFEETYSADFDVDDETSSVRIVGLFP